MSCKRGRKCSIKSCDNHQHTHTDLSFFRFPRDAERCKIWIEKTKRFDLLEKVNVHDERICQQHFEPTMFLNETRNRLNQLAIPTLYLDIPPPRNLPQSEVTSNGIPLADHLLKSTKLGLDIVNAELLYQNNLTITPVFTPKINETQPLNLTKQNDVNNDLNDLPNEHSNQLAITTNLSNAGPRRPRQVFTIEQENQLADYVRETSNYYSGLSSKEVRILAFVYGVCNQVEMPLGWHESHQASFDWCVGFIKRTKLPPTMITGISIKGKAKSNPIDKINGNQPLNETSAKNNIVNITPIEID